MKELKSSWLKEFRCWKFQSRMPLFWRFQLIGWAVFIAASFPLKLDLMGSFSAAFLLCLTRDGTSFLLTLGLRLIYRKYWSENFVVVAALIIAACTLGGLSQIAFFSLIRDFVPESGEIFPSRLMEFSLFYERTGLLYAWSFLYFGVRHAIEGVQRKLKLALLEIQMLRAQMNPHFLFNALNTVLADIGKPREHLKALVRALSAYLRYSLETRNNERVLLGQEYDAIVSYLAVEKARFQEKLEIECRIDADARNALVPGIIIQPLVENAIKYGRRTSPRPLKVRVVVLDLDSNGVQIEVSNTGKWIEPDPAGTIGGIGLENTRRRLKLLYPEFHNFDISCKNGWVTVQIQIFATP
jgi:signal transduction histidine kinase